MKIAFIGGGNMAAALIAGLANQLTAGANIHVVDPNPDALARLQQQYGVSTAAVADATVGAADVIVLAVKPQSMREVAAQLLPLLDAARQPLLVSIAAGIRSADLARWLGGYRAIVRCMPNTPALIGMGITGMVALDGVSATQREQAGQILSAVGQTVWLDDESKIDAVTALSGSGPAYVFYLVECMAEAGRKLGLPADLAMRLARETVSGAGELLFQSSDEAARLRQNVTSPGGTTAAALSVLMAEDGMQPLFDTALAAARKRAEELGR